MQNGKLFRLLLPMTGVVVGFNFMAQTASAQQPEGPGQDDRRPGGQGQGGQGDFGRPRPDGQRSGGPDGPDGPRPGGPGRPAGPPAGFVPGDYLGQYLGLNGGQKQKLDDLMKTLEVMNRENFLLSAFTQLRLTADEVHKIATGDTLKEVLTGEQNQIFISNRRMGRGGPGNPGRPGDQNGTGRPSGPGGREEAAPPPPGGKYDDEAVTPVAAGPLAPGVTRVAVVFSGGYETDPRDGGRPVVLVANGLGVAPEVFREAFSHVRPARAGSEPEPAQVQQNKAALLNALGKYGIDNDQLDRVSNYYRYVRSRNELWTHTPAVANALVKNGVLVGFEVIRRGSGYTSPPSVSVPNVRTGAITVKLAFGKNLATNGSLASLIASPNGGTF